MTKLFRIAAAIAGVALLTACGLTKSPAEDITFTAPADWTSTPGIMGRFQLWTGGPSNAKHVLMLMKLPQDAKIDKSFGTSNMKEMTGPTTIKDATMIEQKDMKICGDQPAMYMKMRGESTSNNEKTDEMIEAVVSKVSDGTFMAMHMYPVGTTPDAQAEAALYELCPKK